MDVTAAADNMNMNNLPEPQPSSTLARSSISKRLLTILNCSLLCLGSAGGPIFSRIYYLHGGSLQWFSSFLETAGFPLLLIPLTFSHLNHRSSDPSSPLFHLTPRLLFYAAGIGLLTGLDDFFYAYGLNFLPVSTSAVLIATQLAFTAIFAFFIVRQKFTPFSINAVVILTVGATMLALHTSGDRPKGVTTAGYWKGFVLTLTSAALYGLVLPLVELAYANGGRSAVTYTVVMEVQFVIGLFATLFCAVGMVAGKDFQAIPKEAAKYGLGESKYYTVIFGMIVFWQLFIAGAIGVITCVNALLAGVLVAVFIPMVELLALILLHENFSIEKGVALLVSLWGLASYSYGEYKEMKNKEKKNKDEFKSQPTTALNSL